MYSQWLKVCAINHALTNEIQELRDLKTKAEGKVVQLEALLAEKGKNFESVITELDKTQKNAKVAQ